MNKIDCLLEEISPTSNILDFLFPTIAPINTGIASVNQIEKVIRFSELSDIEIFFLNSEIRDRTASGDDSFLYALIDYINEKQQEKHG